MIHVNEVKINEDSKFAGQFNACSDLWSVWHDMSLTREERDKAFERWMEERQRLELGIY